MALQMVTAAPHASAVVDEPAHLAAGWLALTQADLTVNREHPPLVKTLAALPLLALRPITPPDPAEGLARSSENFEFAFSREFLYKANDADRLLFAARLPVVALALGAGLALWLWGRAMEGGRTAAATAALWMFAFEPTLLAHGRLVTTDMGAACFGLVAVACLERSLAAGGRSTRWAAGCGAGLGLGLLSRYSCLLLIPLMAAAALLDDRAPLRRRIRTLGIGIGVATLILNAGFGFAGTGAPLVAGPRTGPLRTPMLSALEASPVLRWLPLPVPRLWLEGLDLARWKNLHVEGPGYLDGRLSVDGWWSYFLAAIGMKATLPFLALAGAGLLLPLARRGGAARRDALWTALPALGFVALVTASTRAQIGVRYVLPALPFLCLCAGRAAAALLSSARHGPPVRPAARAACALGAAVLLGWHAAAALAVHPHHLAYFNEAVGGPESGWRHLVDSNLDWGQDLVGLSRFLREQGIDDVCLYYFGTADPDYYGIRRAAPRPGWFAVSATHLAGVYLPDHDYLASFRGLRPETSIGHSIFLYRLDRVPPALTRPMGRP